jgi:hypothetical protein
MGLSAHMQGLTNGTILIAIGADFRSRAFLLELFLGAASYSATPGSTGGVIV